LSTALIESVLIEFSCVLGHLFVSRYQTVPIICAMHHSVCLEISSVLIGVAGDHDRRSRRSLEDILEAPLGARWAVCCTVLSARADVSSVSYSHVRLSYMLSRGYSITGGQLF